MVFCNIRTANHGNTCDCVTILILIDGFLQYGSSIGKMNGNNSHNPYFNRWFSAIVKMDILIFEQESHNPYFNRWFSAIWGGNVNREENHCHNPYFNRWFSAICFKHSKQ